MTTQVSGAVTEEEDKAWPKRNCMQPCLSPSLTDHMRPRLGKGGGHLGEGITVFGFFEMNFARAMTIADGKAHGCGTPLTVRRTGTGTVATPAPVSHPADRSRRILS